MKIIKIPDILKETGRKVRKQMTESEFLLWEKLRDRRLYGKKFIRQYPLYVFTENNGFDRFIIPDFTCKRRKNNYGGGLINSQYKRDLLAG